MRKFLPSGADRAIMVYADDRQPYSQNYISTYAPQGTYWKDGDGGNATKTQDGTTYTRTSAWAFPVKSASIVG